MTDLARTHASAALSSAATVEKERNRRNIPVDLFANHPAVGPNPEQTRRTVV